MPAFRFIPRRYLHFDIPVSEEIARKLATDPAAVASHAFYPLISYTVETRKIRKKPGGGVELCKPKTREIAYAGNMDSHIFGFYAQVLGEHYESALKTRGLHHCVTAFRSLDRKRNIHFANDVFEDISFQPSCAVLAADVSDFFGNIQHTTLKTAWRRLLGVERLPDDHFAVFRAITQYAQVDRTALCRILGLDPENFHADHRPRFCSPLQFRKIVRGNGLCAVNRSGHGIPQGSPISAILSNLYLLEFDTKISAFVTAQGGIYRRYCDDLLIVLPTPALRTDALKLIRELMEQLGLPIHPEKTESTDFIRKDGRLIASKPLNYLGFTFDGKHKRIRPASIARYYKKVRAGIRRAKAIQFHVWKAGGKKSWTPLRRRKLHLLYSYLGRHNFLSYAFEAARIMNDPGIKRQVKAHWKRLQQLIDPPTQ